MNTRKANPAASDLIKKNEQLLAQECMNHVQELSQITQRLDENWKEELLEKTYFVIDVSKAREALKTVISTLENADAGKEITTEEHKYQISSLFINECWKYLISDPSGSERFLLVTGTITQDGTKVLSRMEKVQFGEQSPAYVSGDTLDTHRKIISLDEDYGHYVLAMFHSHMSKGANSTSPSSTDNAFMERMAKFGSNCLGGIFSLDGYLRLFSLQNFEIDVYGKGVEEIENQPSCKVFKIIGAKL